MALVAPCSRASEVVVLVFHERLRELELTLGVAPALPGRHFVHRTWITHDTYNKRRKGEKCEDVGY